MKNYKSNLDRAVMFRFLFDISFGCVVGFKNVNNRRLIRRALNGVLMLTFLFFAAIYSALYLLIVKTGGLAFAMWIYGTLYFAAVISAWLFVRFHAGQGISTLIRGVAVRKTSGLRGFQYFFFVWLGAMALLFLIQYFLRPR